TNPSNRRIRNGFSQRRLGFTLVELLVVIGIIALLVGILLPTLSRARESANEIKCLSNLRSIGQGFAIYTSDNNFFLPAAYVYNNSGSAGIAPDAGGGSAGDPTLGYTHWSFLIYGEGETTPEDAFTCPSFDFDGGLPPTNPKPADRVAGQILDPDFNQAAAVAAGIDFDRQVRRVAYTVNEALVPKNKFNEDIRPRNTNTFKSQRVPITRVRDSTNVILATEYNPDPRVVSELDDPEDPNLVIKSHRPVHGYDHPLMTKYNLDSVPLGSGNGFVAASPPPVPTAAGPFNNRLAWVGRNHSVKGRNLDGVPLRSSNFLYVDGHAENKLIEQTLPQTATNPRGERFQWGNPIYGLTGTPIAQDVPIDE
ncbi:MAG: type II secretion system protein, partial [Planctomycetota bacterium]